MNSRMYASVISSFACILAGGTSSADAQDVFSPALAPIPNVVIEAVSTDGPGCPADTFRWRAGKSRFYENFAAVLERQAAPNDAQAVSGPRDCTVTIRVASDEPVAFAYGMIRGISLPAAARSVSKAYWPSRAGDKPYEFNNLNQNIMWLPPDVASWSACGGAQELKIDTQFPVGVEGQLNDLNVEVFARRCSPGAAHLDAPSTPVAPTSEVRIINGPISPEPTPGIAIREIGPVIVGPNSTRGPFEEVIAPDRQSAYIKEQGVTPGWGYPAPDGRFVWLYKQSIYLDVAEGTAAAWQGLTVRGHAVLEAGARADFVLSPEGQLDAFEPEKAYVATLVGPINGPFYIAHSFAPEALTYGPCGRGRSVTTSNVLVRVDHGKPFSGGWVQVEEIGALKFALGKCLKSSW